MKVVTVRVERMTLSRIPRGVTPTAALMLEDNERLMDVTLRERLGGHERKTVDWTLDATIAQEVEAE